MLDWLCGVRARTSGGEAGGTASTWRRERSTMLEKCRTAAPHGFRKVKSFYFLHRSITCYSIDSRVGQVVRARPAERDFTESVHVASMSWSRAKSLRCSPPRACETSGRARWLHLRFRGSALSARVAGERETFFPSAPLLGLVCTFIASPNGNELRLPRARRACESRCVRSSARQPRDSRSHSPRPQYRRRGRICGSSCLEARTRAAVSDKRARSALVETHHGRLSGTSTACAREIAAALVWGVGEGRDKLLHQRCR
jgi:hypothetical protein